MTLIYYPVRGKLMTKYSKKETIDELKKELSDIEKLYKAKCIKSTGTTTDSNEQYSEVIAQELLKHRAEFDKITRVKRKNSYSRENHCNIEIDICKSNRDEENFAKRITGLELNNLGLIKDYQIPLKDTSANEGIGKIDLISYNEKDKYLFLIELKYTGNPEALLRALLESYIYSKIVDKNKLITDLLGSVNPDEIKIIPSVLLVPKCKSYDELKEMEDGKRPYLKKLSLELGIRFFTMEFFVNEIHL